MVIKSQTRREAGDVGALRSPKRWAPYTPYPGRSEKARWTACIRLDEIEEGRAVIYRSARGRGFSMAAPTGRRPSVQVRVIAEPPLSSLAGAGRITR
jgi:hypothetical protein